MPLGIGLGVNNSASVVGESLPAEAPAVSSAPTVSGSPATVDDTSLTRVAGVYTGSPSPTVTWVWRKGTTEIPGTANQVTYTPDEARADYNVFDTATNASGTVTSASANASAALRAVGSVVLANQTMDENTGIVTYDFSAGVTSNGNTLSHALVSPPTGVTLVGTDIFTDTSIAAGGTQTITVRTTDEYLRTFDDTFDLTVNSVSTIDGRLQHFNGEVAGNSTANITLDAVVLDKAFVHNVNTANLGTGDSLGNSVEGPDETTLGMRLTSTTNVEISREPASLLGNQYSGTVWECLTTGANEFVVRDRRIVTINSGSGDVVTFTPGNLSAIVDADKCIPMITAARCSQTSSSQHDHAMGCVSINRTTGEVAAEGRGGAGTLLLYVDTVEFTGANWTVHYGTNNVNVADSYTLLIDGSPNWGNTALFGFFSKNGGGEGGLADTNPIYRPGSAANEVDIIFNSSHVGVAGQRNTVFALENPEMTVTRFNESIASPAAASTGVNISSVGLAATTDAFLILSNTISGTGTAHPKGFRNARFSSVTSVEVYTGDSGNAVEFELQVVQPPNVGDTGGSPGTPATSAVGFGENTTGGSTSYVVTSTANSGAGTLRDGLSVAGRNITFDLPTPSTITITSRLDVLNNTTVDGEGQDITLRSPTLGSGGIFHLVDTDNVILRNMKMQDVGWDGIQCTRATNVWIDHISLTGNTGDGAFDFIEQSRFITVSRCYITEQDKTMLVGSGNQETPEDSVMSVTFHRCWFHRNRLRQPFLRRGRVHMLNCLISEWGEGVGQSGGARAIESTLNGQTAIENCIFDAGDDKSAIDHTSSTISTPGFSNDIGGGSLLQNGATLNTNEPGNVFTPSLVYTNAYTADVANATLKTTLQAEAGWQNAAFWA